MDGEPHERCSCCYGFAALACEHLRGTEPRPAPSPTPPVPSLPRTPGPCGGAWTYRGFQCLSPKSGVVRGGSRGCTGCWLPPLRDGELTEPGLQRAALLLPLGRRPGPPSLCLLTSVSRKALTLPQQRRCSFPWQLACFLLLQLRLRASLGCAELARGRQRREASGCGRGHAGFSFSVLKFTSESCRHLVSLGPETRTKSGRAGSRRARSGTWVCLSECLVKGPWRSAACVHGCAEQAEAGSQYWEGSGMMRLHHMRMIRYFPAH